MPGATGEFSSPQLTFHADSHSVSLLLLCPWSFCPKCRWQVTVKYAWPHPWPHEVGVGWLGCLGIVWRAYNGKKHACNLSGNTHPESPQLDEPLWTDSGLKSGTDVCVDLNFKKKKKRRWLRIVPLMQGKSHHHHFMCCNRCVVQWACCAMTDVLCQGLCVVLRRVCCALTSNSSKFFCDVLKLQIASLPPFPPI